MLKTIIFIEINASYTIKFFAKKKANNRQRQSFALSFEVGKILIMLI